MIAALTAAFLFAGSATTARYISRTFNQGAQANLYRLFVAVILLGAWSIPSGQAFGKVGWGTLFVSGIIGFGLGDVALFYALSRLGARLTIMVIHCLATPIASIFEYIFLGTVISPLESLVIAVILTGVFISLWGQPLAQQNSENQSRKSAEKDRWIGWAWALTASLGQAGGAFLSRSAYQEMEVLGESTDAISCAWIRMLGGILFSFVYIAIFQGPGHIFRWPPHCQISRTSFLGLITLNAVLGPALGVTCYQWALATTPTALVLPIVALAPVLLIPISFRIDGVRPSKISILGGLLALTSVVILGVSRK